MHTFGATKALDLMFTFELARRAKRWDVRANAFHPGLIRSDLMREAPRPVRTLVRLVARSARRAAVDPAELALSPSHSGTTRRLFFSALRVNTPTTFPGSDCPHVLTVRTNRFDGT